MLRPVSLASDCSTHELLLGTPTFIMVSYDINLPTSLRVKLRIAKSIILIFLILHTKEWPILMGAV